jgi:hypothetical protein
LQLEVQYLHEHEFSFTTAVDLNKSPAVDFSATIGTPTIAFGAEASYLQLLEHLQNILVVSSCQSQIPLLQ